MWSHQVHQVECGCACVCMGVCVGGLVRCPPLEHCLFHCCPTIKVICGGYLSNYLTSAKTIMKMV